MNFQTLLDFANDDICVIGIATLRSVKASENALLSDEVVATGLEDLLRLAWNREPGIHGPFLISDSVAQFVSKHLDMLELRDRHVFLFIGEEPGSYQPFNSCSRGDFNYAKEVFSLRSRAASLKTKLEDGVSSDAVIEDDGDDLDAIAEGTNDE